MNITVPQDIQTKTELEEMADVKHVMISAGTSKPIMGLKQDGLIGAYNMTKPTTKIGWKSVMDMLVNLKLPKTEIIEKNKIYSGHELFSCIIPERINKSNFGQAREILIQSGHLISGYLRKVALGEEQENNIIQLILDEYGVNEAKDFFDNAQKIVNKFNMDFGFSVGLIDMNLTKEIKKSINALVDKEILKANVYTTNMENNTNMMDPETYENTMSANLNNVMNEASALITKNMTDDNSIFVMATAGSKGNQTNTGQMIGLLGQQDFEGKRFPKKIGKRTLPYFHQNDDSAAGRGFIKNNFLTGLEFSEYVYHHSTARIGLIDTAIKTAETGYIQRKLIKSMEDILVGYDCTLRTATGSIIQFIYGDSGTDTTKQYSYSIDLLLLNNKDLEKKYKFNDDEIKSLSGFNKKMNEEYFEMIKNFRDTFRQSQRKTKLDYKSFKSYIIFRLPVNLTRIMDKVKNMKGDGKILTPDYVIKRLDEIVLHTNTHLVCVPNNVDEKKSIKILDETTAKMALKLAIHNALAPKRSILEYKLTKDIFEFALNEITAGFKKNLAEPGEMVGIIAVQSLMPPLTQLTLNTFHQSGVGSKGHSTIGVARLKELVSLTRSLKTPKMSIYLDKENQKNKDTAHRIAAHIKQTNIIHIRNKIDVYYDPNPTEKGNFAELDNVGKPFYVHSATSSSCQANINDLPWLIRIEFDREKLLLKDVTLLDIQSRFCSMWESRFQDLKKASKGERSVLEKITRCGIVGNSDNDDVPVLHIRFDMVDFTMGTIADLVEIVIDNLKMKGIDSIVDVDPGEEACIDFNNPEQEMREGKEYVVLTSGINMYDIRFIEGVDVLRTCCNDVMQIYDIFGIEAARIALLRELTNMIEGAGKFVNYHHVSVIVDLMTRDGVMISIDRHGMGRTDAAPLGKVSFEKPVEQLLIASVFNETDPMKGVSARIMAGNVIKGGTGLCGLMLDTDMIEKSEYIEDETVEKQEIIEETENKLIDNVMKLNQEDIFIPE